MRAGAAFRVNMAAGKFHGVSSEHTPIGWTSRTVYGEKKREIEEYVKEQRALRAEQVRGTEE